MLAVRIHLDRADSSNGGLRVLPGTHRMGRLSGEALLMRPLLLHASSRAVDPRARRVIPIEYGNCDLDGGLAWLGR